MKRISAFLMQVLLLFTLLLIAPNVGQAAAVASEQQVKTVQSLENTLFAIHYDQESLDARLARIETTVFGQPQPGAASARINKLQSVLSPSTLGPLSPTAAKTATPVADKNAKQTTAMSNQSSKSKQKVVQPVVTQPQPLGKSSAPATAADNVQPLPQAAAPIAGETDYPTVSQMEQKLFGKTFVKEDITVRLARLEKQVFKTPQSGVLADRVDNLRLTVLGEIGAPQPTAAMAYNDPSNVAYAPQAPSYAQAPMGSGSGYYQSYQNGSGYPQPPNYSASGYSGTPIASTQPYYQGNYPPTMGGDPMGGYASAPAPAAGGTYSPSMSAAAGNTPTPDMLAAITEVEKEVLGKTYPSEPLDTRLDRVETKVFNATSPEMSADDRMQRVIAVASAGGAPQSPKAKAKSTFQTILPIILTILPMVLL